MKPYSRFFNNFHRKVTKYLFDRNLTNSSKKNVVDFFMSAFCRLYLSSSTLTHITSHASKYYQKEKQCLLEVSQILMKTNWRHVNFMRNEKYSRTYWVSNAITICKYLHLVQKINIFVDSCILWIMLLLYVNCI